MAFTYGFYNALNNDRTYNAYQFSTLFDGIIVDGVFETIGQHFAVTAGTGMSVNIGTGRAWFNHTWNENDSVMPLNLPQSDLNRARYDAIVIEVGDPNTDRTNTIKVVSGTPAVNPVKPTLNRGASGNSGINTSDETDPPWQHALAYVLVPAGSESVSASNIEIVVGMNETPFVTGPLETRSIEELFNQWDAQFTSWFNNLKAQLTDNVVTNLQAQIDDNKASIEEIEEDYTGFKNQFNIEIVTHTDVITESGNFKNPNNFPINVSVLLFGGGAGGIYASGGGGGNMKKWTGTIAALASVPVTIGTGGASGSNGGTTSFGTYASANGGSGVSGGTGGGGGGGGGNGSYGGGGGAGGLSGNKLSYDGYAGGNGGTYGGGGGGSGAASWNTDSYNGGNGGSGGSGCGVGGKGGRYTGGNGGAGTNTTALNLDFTGAGSGGTGGDYASHSYTYQGHSYYVCSGGGGGGGGGYGGNGGKGGGSSIYYSTSSYVFMAGGGGGGGGGYGANGGKGGNSTITENGSSSTPNRGGGGGGGGYGGKGGDGTQYGNSGYSGQGYGSGGGAPDGGGGGGGYGTTPSPVASTSGRSGICIVRYTVREISIKQPS